MQFTPQQLSGGQKYGGMVKIGNWAEDRARLEVEAKDYELRRSKGALGTTTAAAALGVSTQSVPHSYSADGQVRYGDAVMLSASEEDKKGVEQTVYLGANLGTVVDWTTRSISVSASANGKPQARSVFVITPTPKSKYVNGDVLNYGDSFLLCSNPSLRVDSKTNMVLPPYNLEATPASTILGSGTGGNQLSVSMGLRPTSNSLWVAIAADGNRLAKDGTPVPANEDIGILHQGCNIRLGSRIGASVATDFGTEQAVHCESYRSTGRGSSAACLPGNRWKLVTASDAAAAVDNRGLVPLTADYIINNVKETISARGAYGLRGMVQAFRAMDASGDGVLDADDFKFGMRDMGVILSDDELAILMDHFDTDKSGGVSLTEFTRALRGDLNKRRQALVNKAFARLDTDGSGVVTVDDLATVYDVSSHPGVADGRVTVKEALKEFLGGWEGQDKDGMVTLKEFSDYYADLSAGIDSDDYFSAMMRHAWDIKDDAIVADDDILVHVTMGNGSLQTVRIPLSTGITREDHSAIADYIKPRIQGVIKAIRIV